MSALAALLLTLGGLAPTVALTARGRTLHRLVGLELMSVVAVVVLLLLARAAGRSAYVDVALLLAVLTFAGSLVFARFLGRSL